MKNGLTTVLGLLILFVSITACGGKKDTIASVKKGHFTAAPNITVEELVKRYQYIESDTTTWKLENDINNNEHVISASHFEGTDILLAGILEKVWSDITMDVSVVSHYWDEFFFKFLGSMNSGNHETYDFRIDDIPIDEYTAVGHNDIFSAYGTFDHDDHMTIFFKCTGGEFIIDFVVNNDGSVDVKGGKLILHMVSPVFGKDVDYECIYNLNGNLIKEKLLSNSDLGIENL